MPQKVDMSNIQSEVTRLYAEAQGYMQTPTETPAPAPVAAVVAQVPVVPVPTPVPVSAPVVAAATPADPPAPAVVVPVLPAVASPMIPIPPPPAPVANPVVAIPTAPAPQAVAQPIEVPRPVPALSVAVPTPPAPAAVAEVAAPVPVVAVPIPVPAPVNSVVNDEGENNMANATQNKVSFPEGTPKVVVTALKSGQTTKQIISSLHKMMDEHPEIARWLESTGQRGRVAASLEQYAEVKRTLREKTGIKPKPRPAANAPSAEQAAQNFGAAASMVSSMTIPTPPQPVVQASGDQPVIQAPMVQLGVDDVVAALTPGAAPLKKFLNETTGRKFYMWTDFCAARIGEYALHFRHFTVGDNTKPSPNDLPKAYLIRNGQVLSSLASDELIALLNLMNEMGKSGKMTEVFQHFQKIAQPTAG